MQTTSVKLYSLEYSEAKTYLAAALFLAGNIVLPQLCHLVQLGGPTMLPIYFFTLVGAYKYGWRAGLLTALASPLANAALFGMPAVAALPAILVKSVLLAGAVVIGAMLGGASDEDCRRLRRFAVELGLAFQLQDDLLDSYGDQRLGKAIGGDILEGKKTYLMITAMSRADEATREMLRTAYRDPALSDAEKIGKVKSIYDRLDVPRLTEQQIQLRFERALSILDTLSVEPSRTQRMRDYAMSLMDRKK